MKYEHPDVRFARLVGEPNANGCREWLGSRNKDGYGQFWGGKAMIKAHRFVFIRENGPLPADKRVVMHSCDNPGCVELSHLSAGTDLENVRHMYEVERSRHAAREENGNARLTEKEVSDLRAFHRIGFTQAALARQFGIAQSHVGRIVRQENWK